MESVGMRCLDLKADVMTRVVLLFVDLCICYHLISIYLSVLWKSKTASSRSQCSNALNVDLAGIDLLYLQEVSGLECGKDDILLTGLKSNMYVSATLNLRTNEI